MKLKRFKLNALAAKGLRQKEMDAIIGGYSTCRCSCYWENNGGSPSGTNMIANAKYGYYSTEGCNQFVLDTELGIGGDNGNITA